MHRQVNIVSGVRLDFDLVQWVSNQLQTLLKAYVSTCVLQPNVKIIFLCDVILTLKFNPH